MKNSVVSLSSLLTGHLHIALVWQLDSVDVKRVEISILPKVEKKNQVSLTLNVILRHKNKFHWNPSQ